MIVLFADGQLPCEPARNETVGAVAELNPVMVATVLSVGSPVDELAGTD